MQGTADEEGEEGKNVRREGRRAEETTEGESDPRAGFGLLSRPFVARIVR